MQFAINLTSVPGIGTLWLMCSLLLWIVVEIKGPYPSSSSRPAVAATYLLACVYGVIEYLLAAAIAVPVAIGLYVMISGATLAISRVPAPPQQAPIERPAAYEITPGDESDLKVRADLLRQGIYEEQVPSYDQPTVGKVISRAIEAAKQRSL